MSKVTSAQLAVFAVDELERGVKPSDVAKKIAGFLLDNRQSREVGKILRAIEAEMNRRGQSQVTITSAHAISDSVKKELAALLEAKNPVFDEHIDTSVIGGVRARSGETEIDLTVRGRLQKFKTKIVNQQ